MVGLQIKHDYAGAPALQSLEPLSQETSRSHFSGPPPINLSHQLRSPPNRIIDCAHGWWNLLCAFILPASSPPRIDVAISGKQVASAFGARPLLRCNRGVFVANDADSGALVLLG
jgi:hypothetical protein